MGVRTLTIDLCYATASDSTPAARDSSINFHSKLSHKNGRRQCIPYAGSRTWKQSTLARYPGPPTSHHIYRREQSFIPCLLAQKAFQHRKYITAKQVANDQQYRTHVLSRVAAKSLRLGKRAGKRDTYRYLSLYLTHDHHDICQVTFQSIHVALPCIQCHRENLQADGDRRKRHLTQVAN